MCHQNTSQKHSTCSLTVYSSKAMLLCCDDMCVVEEQFEEVQLFHVSRKQVAHSLVGDMHILMSALVHD